MKKFYSILAVLLLAGSMIGAKAETIAKSEPYDARVALPKPVNEQPPVLTSDYEEDETVEYKGK